MTLVELLVVVAIICLLLAVSVPILKPMLESRKTSNAAQVLAGALQQARLKSIQEGRSYGVRLIPFGTAPTVSVQLQMEAAPTYVVTLNPPDVRVRVENGTIVPYRFYIDDKEGAPQEGRWEAVRSPNKRTEILALFQPGDEVQFNRLGRFFVIGNNHRLISPYHELNFPEEELLSSNEEMNDAMEYRLVSLWKPLSTWQTIMPHGSVVDLAFSGGETDDFTNEGIPAQFSSGDDVVVMFSPAGHVDEIRINGISRKVNEMLYFCVGEWDRQMDANTKITCAEDRNSNLEVSATCWVSLHPKTGGVRIAENVPSNSIREARKFAREHFFNVGGW